MYDQVRIFTLYFFLSHTMCCSPDIKKFIIPALLFSCLKNKKTNRENYENLRFLFEFLRRVSCHEEKNKMSRYRCFSTLCLGVGGGKAIFKLWPLQIWYTVLVNVGRLGFATAAFDVLMTEREYLTSICHFFTTLQRRFE